MRNQLPVGVHIVLSSRDAQSRHIDWDMQNAKEGERKHGRNGLQDSRPVGDLEICSSGSEKDGFMCELDGCKAAGK